MRHALLLLMFYGCGGGYADPSREFAPPLPEGTQTHKVRIHKPAGLGVADVTIKDSNGVPIGVRCATCHGPEPDLSWVSPSDAPDDFHGNVELVHGTNTCESCHAEDRTKLHLADGTLLDVEDAMTLCAQCHGVQFRDYSHGSHGGMTGYWDLSQGGRDRNHCIDCHAPHAPAYQPVLPVFPPRDRYLEVNKEDHSSGGEH